MAEKPTAGAGRSWRALFKKFSSQIRIVSKEVSSGTDPRGVKLDPWTSQQRALDMVLDGLAEDIHDFTVLKSRQLGITTEFLLILVFWLAVHPGIIAAFVVDSEENRDTFRDTTRRYVNSLPPQFAGDAFRIVKGGDNKSFMKFSNGARLDFLVAGKSKANWGESRGYSAALLSEVSKYGNPDGLANFKEGLAENNPERLFLYESTANGMNHWREHWIEAGRDMHTKRRIFVGWWSKSLNTVKITDRRFALYGSYDPDQRERELIDKVREEYGWEVTMEQLAWYRWRCADESRTMQSMEQNQPWYAEQAFVLSGFSFFQTRKIQEQWNVLMNVEPVYFEGFRFWLGTDFWASKMEEITTMDRIHEVELRVWEQPVVDATYVIGADPAGGRNDNADRHCADEKTEILTKQGWRRYDQISVGDEAVCFDVETGAYSYGGISDVLIKDHDGPMLHFSTQSLDCLVTPEHRVVSRSFPKLRCGAKAKWNVKPAAVIASGGVSQHEIPIGGSPIGSGVDGLSLEMCRVIGWVLTDGYIGLSSSSGDGSRFGQKSRRRHITVAQSLRTNKGGRHIVGDMLVVIPQVCPGTTMTIMPPKPEVNTGPALIMRFGVQSAESLLSWLDEDDNRIPRLILKEGSREQLEALFQGIAEGDGSWDDRWGWIKIAPGCHEGFADDVQELAVKLGYSATRAVQPAANPGERDQWIIRLSKRKAHSFYANETETENYSGKVWCVTVPTGAFVARRNGKTFVTGNCVSVWRCYADKLVQVAEYADSNSETRQMAWVLAFLGGAYKNCMINLEITGGFGHTVMTELDNIRNQLRAEVFNQKTADRGWQDFLVTARWYLYHKPDSPGAGYVYNWNSTFDAKNRMLSGMRDAHVTDVLLIKSLHLLDEMAIVVQDGGTIGAPNKQKDDRVFAAALACEAWNRWFRPQMLAEGYTYDITTRLETGQASAAENLISRLVQNTLKRTEEYDDEAQSPNRVFLEERGLFA